MQPGTKLPVSRKKDTLREKLHTANNVIKGLEHEVKELKKLINEDVPEGSKYRCIGEFDITINHECSACGYHGAEDDCEVCGGEVEYTQKHTIPWATCKDIYALMKPQLPKGK